MSRALTAVVSVRGLRRPFPLGREEMTVRHRYCPMLRALPWDVLSIARFLRKQSVGRRAGGQD